MTLNLKFMRQGYKFKDPSDEDKKKNLGSASMQNKAQQIFYLSQNNLSNEETQVIADTIDNSEQKTNQLNFHNPYLHLNNDIQESLVNQENQQNSIIENQKLQSYTFISSQEVLNENLATGRYLKGVIRINKCHTHGYITVSGLINDILIRGNRNLNQSLHLDEVVVELFPIVCWKPLFNRKIRKLSLVEGSQHALKNSEDLGNKSKENTEAQQLNYYTDTERDKEDDLFLKDDASPYTGESKIKSSQKIDYNSDTNINDFSDRKFGERSDSGQFKENFESLEDRLRYINQVFNLRPEGRIVKIVHSPNVEKPQIVRIMSEKSLIFACPIDDHLPKIFIKMKKFRRLEFLRKLETDSNFRNKYFLVKIVGWALNFKCPKGIILNEMGNCGDVEVETEVLLRTCNIDYGQEYPYQAMEELKQFESK